MKADESPGTSSNGVTTRHCDETIKNVPVDDNPHLNTWRPARLASDDFPHVRQAALVMGDALRPADHINSFAD